VALTDGSPQRRGNCLIDTLTRRSDARLAPGPSPARDVGVTHADGVLRHVQA